MRDVKFRAWDGIRMTASGIMFNTTEGILKVPKGSGMKLMQYTGLKDKNGVEIYEGDIVRSTFKSRIGLSETDVYIVEYDNVNPCFVMKSITKEYGYEYDFVQVGLRVNEVIGNIYENPELLVSIDTKGEEDD